VGGLTVRAAVPEDRATVVELLTRSWRGVTVVAHGVRYQADTLPALLAERAGTTVGLLTYHLDRDGLEVVTIDAPVPGTGVGTALLRAAAEVARTAGAGRVWLVTTNDNLDALRFYQRRGMRISAVAPGGVDAARRLKPGIPLVGQYGIGLHDELTLTLDLDPAR